MYDYWQMQTLDIIYPVTIYIYFIVLFHLLFAYLMSLFNFLKPYVYFTNEINYILLYLFFRYIYIFLEYPSSIVKKNKIIIWCYSMTNLSMIKILSFHNFFHDTKTLSQPVIRIYTLQFVERIHFLYDHHSNCLYIISSLPYHA